MAESNEMRITDDRLKFLRLVLRDMKAATGMADAAANVALVHAEAGRAEEALQAALGAEPSIHDAQRLFSLSTYVKGLGMAGEAEDDS